MTLSTQEENVFKSCLQDLYRAGAEEGDFFQKARAKAWERFIEVGLPTKRSEPFQYLKLRRMFSETYLPSATVDLTVDQIEKYFLPECLGAVLVFVNGHFNPELSLVDNLPERIVISSMDKAARTYGSFINNQWTRMLQEEKDPFVLLNAALNRHGAFVYIPPKTLLERPIQILSVIATADQRMMILPRLQVFVGAHSEVNFIMTNAAISGSHYFVNQVEEFILEENTHVQCIQDACDQSEGVWYFDAFRSIIKGNSTLKVTEATKGGTTVRHDYRVVLIGENSEAFLNGVWLLDRNREAHVHVVVEHQAPHCHSNQFFRGVLNDFGRSSFEGKILIRKEAQKTDAYQLNNNLLLSNRAKADSKPNLEIFADDVKASHGSTVGQLNPSHLFYLKTRGIPDQEARSMMVYGFCQEVIEKISIPSLVAKLNHEANHFLMKE